MWDWDRPGNIKRDIAILNRFRRDNPALQRADQPAVSRLPRPEHPGLREDDRRTGATSSIAVVNLDPHGVHGGDVALPLRSWELIRARNFGSRRRLPGMSCPGAASGSISFSTRRSTRRCCIGLLPAMAESSLRSVTDRRVEGDARVSSDVVEDLSRPSMSPPDDAPAGVCRPPRASRAAGRRGDPLWYKDAMIYQLHVKAFFDAEQ